MKNIKGKGKTFKEKEKNRCGIVPRVTAANERGDASKCHVAPYGIFVYANSMGFRSILVARETVGKGHEAREVAAAARGEGNEAEVGLHAEGDAIGELIAREGLYAGIEAPGTGSGESVAVVIEFAAALLRTIALGLLLARNAAGNIWA